jgi:hypothetical protein
MAGGRLRDSAYEGFPLGSGAVILNRLGSCLGVGPEAGTEDAQDATEAYEAYYRGWLIGPAGVSPRIAWDGGDQNGGYIEVRPGRLALSANVTVKKSVGLIYSVWFINGAQVTIDAANEGDTTTSFGGLHGLFANGDSYKFYGTGASSGGQNPAYPAAGITVKDGSTLHQMFLTPGGEDAEVFISPGAGQNITIKNNGGSGEVQPTVYETGTGISGYLNWNIPGEE